MKVALSGATGFIGRHVLAELIERGVDVTCLVRPSSMDKASSLGVRMVPVDIYDPPVDVHVAAGSPDVLVHLAWNDLSNYQSLSHFEQELPAQYRFLREMLAGGLSNLVVSGTCFEYGMQSGGLRETSEALPTNPYGFAKDTLRRQIQYLQQTLPFNLVWSRLFYLYGSGQPRGSLFSLLEDAVEQGQASFDMSGGEQLRDYLPVTDVARNLVSLALTRQDLGIVNICSGEPISVRRLVEGWVSENGWVIDLNLGHYPYPDYEPMAFWGDDSKLKQILGKNE